MRNLGERVFQLKLFGQRVPACSFQMADDHLLVEIHIRSTTAGCPAMKKIGIKAGEHQKLVGTLHVDEKALVRCGLIKSFDVVHAVKAFLPAGGELLARSGRKPKVRAHNRDVVSNLEILHPGAFERVPHQDEKEKLGGKKRCPTRHHERLKELWVIKDEVDGFRIIQQGHHACAILLRQRK